MRRLRALVWSAFIIPFVALSADSPKPDPWAPLRFLVGRWEGTTEGQPGHGTVARSYGYVLGDRFIHERSTSTYPPQEKNKKGEVHEHLSMFSYDRMRKVLVLRQFHTEGFVNQYTYSGAAGGSTTQIVFESDTSPVWMPSQQSARRKAKTAKS